MGKDSLIRESFNSFEEMLHLMMKDDPLLLNKKDLNCSLPVR